MWISQDEAPILTQKSHYLVTNIPVLCARVICLANFIEHIKMRPTESHLGYVQEPGKMLLDELLIVLPGVNRIQVLMVETHGRE